MHDVQPVPSADGRLPAVSLQGATVVRAGGGAVLRDLTWCIHDGESWAVVGPVGSGKTTLAEALLGRHRLETGAIAWPLLDRLRAEGRSVAWPSEVIQLVSFREESWLFSYSRHYYQQRFNFIEPQDDLTLEDFLRSGTAAEPDRIAVVARQMGIASLRSLSLIKLSNGQTRRARIARALLHRPELLILDDPFLGLDASGRTDVAALLGEVGRGGVRIVLITRPCAVPAWVTHILELDGHSSSWQGTREDFQRRRRHPAPEENSAPPAPPPTLPATAVPIIELRHVHVAYGEQAILRDVSWTVRTGERWAVLGPNGSGKTTLLSLLAADHPQAYANDIRLFGRKRGSGESIWDIKQKLGLVSPELHLYFSEPLSAAQTAATGFFDVLSLRPTTPEQETIVRDLFRTFGVAGLANRPFARLSTGEQRLVLLIRALVKRPPLLILDEPFQGLDDRLVRRLQQWIDEELRPEQTLLFVSHHAEEIPRTVNRRLCLAEGRVVESS
jgi:molybdate transport system ATP-binding protein